MDGLLESGEANMHSENIAQENGSASGDLAEGFDNYAQVNGVSNGHKEHKSEKKDKHRDKEKDRDKDRDKDRHRDKDKHKNKDKHRDKDREKSKDKHSSSSKDKERSDKDKDKDRSDKKERSEHKSSSSKDKDRERDKSSSSKDKSDKDKDRHKSSSSSGHKSSSKDKDREKSKDGEHKSKDGEHKSKDGEHRSKDKERDKERSKDKERDKDKERSKDKDKERSKDKERDKDKERSKDKERDKDKERSKDKERDKERSKDKHKDHRDKERSKDKSKGDKSSRDKDRVRDKDREKDKSKHEGESKPIKMERLSSEFEVKEEEEGSPVKNHHQSAGDDSPFIKQENQSCDLNESSFTRPDDMFVKEEAGSTEDEGYHDTSKSFKREESDSEDDVALATKLNKSANTVKRKIESDSEDDVPLMARAAPKKVKKEKEKVAKKKRKSNDDEEEEEDFKPAAKKKKTAKPPVKTEAPSPRKKKKEEETQEVWKWWEEEKKDNKVKWNFLEHKGPLFAPPYEPLPSNVKFYYDGKEIRLSEPAEEVASFYAKMLEHDYTTKDIFNKNFFKDWRKTMSESERSTITDLSKCNFRPMNKYFLEQTEIRKAMSKEEKKAIKEKNDEIQKEMGFCKIDGHTEKIGNFRIEPPGLFRGRGEHPKMGMLKKRVNPEDVIINCSKDSKIPVAPQGHKWKEVRHDNSVTWLASWTENVQQQVKYVMLNPSSKLKGEKDWQKYETARKLAKCIDKIREDYRNDWKSKEMRTRQRAVAMYFIDKLALRAGNEKDEDQADTVGCCSLRVEHIELAEERDGKEYVVIFDFLGKDSIRYYNEVPVEKRVFKNLQLFMENKKPGDDLFDRLNTSVLNKYLSDLMDGLTAKVFRTYNASWTLQQQLNLLTNEDDTVAEKILSYNRANRAVAILCNHQRSVPKSHDKSMENLKGKIEAKKEQLREAEKIYKDCKKSKGHSVTEKVALEKRKKAVEKLREQLNKLEIQETDREENKTIALGTSKLNYLDPRISVAWCKKYDVPIEKIYNKTQRDKFRWAIDMAGPDYVF